MQMCIVAVEGLEPPSSASKGQRSTIELHGKNHFVDDKDNNYFSDFQILFTPFITASTNLSDKQETHPDI